jgi:DNA repair protein RadC
MKTFIHPDQLTDIELLSKIISGRNATSKAEYLLKNVSLDKLLETKPEAFSKLFYLTPSQVQNLENFKSFRRRALVKKELDQIKCSQDAKNIFRPYLTNLDHEEFFVLYLNRANKVLKVDQISKGGLSGTVTDVRMILRNALFNTASGILVAHNHPSGNLNPSESDTKITQKIKEAGSLMDIQLLDHLIISDDDFYSFADNGLL